MEEDESESPQADPCQPCADADVEAQGGDLLHRVGVT